MTFDKIGIRPIYWTDKNGVTHACEGDYIHREPLPLIWTKCGKHDVPANCGYLADMNDKVTCEDCIKKMQEAI